MCGNCCLLTTPCGENLPQPPTHTPHASSASAKLKHNVLSSQTSENSCDQHSERIVLSVIMSHAVAGSYYRCRFLCDEEKQWITSRLQKLRDRKHPSHVLTVRVYLWICGASSEHNLFFMSGLCFGIKTQVLHLIWHIVSHCSGRRFCSVFGTIFQNVYNPHFYTKVHAFNGDAISL